MSGRHPDFEPPEALAAGGASFRLLAWLGGSPQGPEELKWGYVAPVAAEWSQPGMLDLILGCITGSYSLIPGGRAAAGVAWHRPIQMQMAGVPFVGEWRVRAAIAHWNADGAPEMLTLDDRGYLALFGCDTDGGAEQLRPLGRTKHASGTPL